MSLAPAISRRLLELDFYRCLSPISSMDRISSRVNNAESLQYDIARCCSLCLALFRSGRIYGVTSSAVLPKEQTRLGSLALGAQSRSVITMIVKAGCSVVLVGIAIGSIASLILTRLLKRSFLVFTSTDPLTFVTIGILLAFVALLASWIPARRAARVDPRRLCDTNRILGFLKYDEVLLWQE
jgi:hypothetical protein